VHQEFVVKRLFTALAAYVVLAVLAWTTLTDQKLKFGALFEASPRQFVLSVMAVLAILTLFSHWRQQAQRRLDEGRDD